MNKHNISKGLEVVYSYVLLIIAYIYKNEMSLRHIIIKLKQFRTTYKSLIKFQSNAISI